jgi:hypothetical protein
MSILAKVQDDFDKPIVGLEDGGDIVAKCKGCDKPVFKVVKVKDEPLVINWFREQVIIAEQRFSSNCPFCNYHTRTISVTGQVIYAGIDDKTKIDDTSIDKNDNILVTTLEVSKI